MIFSADFYPTDNVSTWALPGAEIMLDKAAQPQIRTYEALISKGVYISVHAPMLVAIGSAKRQVRYMSTEVVCDNLSTMKRIQPGKMNHIVVHAANFSNRPPAEVFEVQRKTLWSLWYKMKERGLLDCSLICIENLGKINQVGDIEDIIKLCSLTDNFVPCIDFGHLHGRTLGKQLNSKEEFEEVFKCLYSGLPRWKVNQMHIHFSKLLYTDKGEKKHTTFSDKDAGPKPAFFLRALSSQPKDFNPVIVCESPDSYRDGLKLWKNFEARSRTVL